MVTTEQQEMVKKIREQVLAAIDRDETLSDEAISARIRQAIVEEAAEHPMTVTDRYEVEHAVFNSLRKLDVLQDLLDADNDVTEIMINGPDDIFLERRGKIVRSSLRFSSKEKLEDVVQQIVARTNKTVNESHPIADTHWVDGSRIHIVAPPVAVDGCMISIRRFPKESITMEKLIALGSLNEEMAEFLKGLVAAGYNLFISGGTGSGKTTFLNALTEYIPKGERVITIEDSAELQVIGVENLVRFEAREATLEGKLEISIRDLVKTSLRMRPDRIIVGECRGAEALEVLTASNSGHDGTMSTGHANSAKDMVHRLSNMVLMASVDLPLTAIRQQIASGIDIFVHLGRLSDGSRKVLEISEVTGVERDEVILNPLYSYEITDIKDRVNGQWVRKENLVHCKKAERIRRKWEDGCWKVLESRH